LSKKSFNITLPKPTYHAKNKVRAAVHITPQVKKEFDT